MALIKAVVALSPPSCLHFAPTLPAVSDPLLSLSSDSLIDHGSACIIRGSLFPLQVLVRTAFCLCWISPTPPLCAFARRTYPKSSPWPVTWACGLRWKPALLS